MYSETIVNERLDMAAEVLGWRPEYHSAEEVDRFKEDLDSDMKFGSDGKAVFSRDLTPREFRFIQNERILCQSDCAYWLTRYSWVSDETNTAVRFMFRDTQRLLFEIMSDLESTRQAIQLLVAKGRQVYVTTLIQQLVTHRVSFFRDVNSITASADRDKSAEMMKKAFFTYDHMPWWLKPRYSRRIESIPGFLEFDTLDSRMTILHGSTMARTKGAQRGGVARGTTPTVAHLSEVATFPAPEQQIEAAIFRSIHFSPKVLLILESTFAGDKGWFPEKYKYAKANFDSGLSRLKAVFLHWPCAHEIYPTKTWWESNRRHIPYGWRPSGKVAEQILKAEMFMRNTPLLAARFGAQWEMPLEQQWFYHVSYTEAEQSGTLPTLLQEMPCDDIEAMQSSFDNVFGREVIEIVTNNRRKEFDIYGFCGHGIDERFEPPAEVIDYSKQRRLYVHRTRRNELYRWELIPLLTEPYQAILNPPTGQYNDISAREMLDARFVVWHRPDPTRTFSMGGDASNGIGQDASVLNMNMTGINGTPDRQASEFRSHLVGHVELWAFAMVILLYYGGKIDEVQSWPLIAIEQLASVGDTCQKELKKLGVPLSRFFNFGRYDGKEEKTASNKLGWFSTGWSRPMLLGAFVHAVKNGWYIPNSPITIEECRQFEIHKTEGGKEKLEHAADHWDDGIFSNAISYFCAHDRDSIAERSTSRYKSVDTGGLPDVDITPYAGHSFNPNSRPLRLDDILYMGVNSRLRRG